VLVVKRTLEGVKKTLRRISPGILEDVPGLGKALSHNYLFVRIEAGPRRRDASGPGESFEKSFS
jgi:hypothetical protein